MLTAILEGCTACQFYICFCPTDERTLVLAYNKGELSFSFELHFCSYLLLYASVRLLHLKL